MNTHLLETQFFDTYSVIRGSPFSCHRPEERKNRQNQRIKGQTQSIVINLYILLWISHEITIFWISFDDALINKGYIQRSLENRSNIMQWEPFHSTKASLYWKKVLYIFKITERFFEEAKMVHWHRCENLVLEHQSLWCPDRVTLVSHILAFYSKPTYSKSVSFHI